jgi:hypothetical protein
MLARPHRVAQWATASRETRQSSFYRRHQPFGQNAMAGALFLIMVTEDEFQDFLTLPAYERITTTVS